MSKKDYIAIANVIKDIDTYCEAKKWTVDAHFVRSSFIQELSRLFKIDNPNFDGGRFQEYIISDKRYKDFTDK